jgi:predicted transcriptional regulator
MANPGFLASMMFENDESAESLSEEEFEGDSYEELANTPTAMPATTSSIPASALPTTAPLPAHREWGNAQTEYLLDMLRERIVESGFQSFRAKDWAAMRERLVAHFPLDTSRQGVHLKDKWAKMRQQYFRQKKIYNVSGDNSGLTRWTWYNAMDAMLSETAKANGVPGANDQGAPVIGTEAVPNEVEFNDAAIRAGNLPGVCGAVVKRRKLNNDMASALDRFAESSARIEKMKMETAIQLARDNKKFELDVLQATQASQERVAALFADVIRSQRTGKDHVAE